MRDIISTFAEFGPMAKRKLPSEQALTDLFAGAQAAEREVGFTSGGELEVDSRPTADPNRPMVKGLPKKKGGTGMKMLAGGLQGLSQMPQSDPMPGLRGYYQGGRIRKGQAGVVGDEIVEVDEEGATVIPAERMVSRTPEGELEIDARQVETMASPDTRQLLSQDGGEQYGLQQTAQPDELATKEAALAEAMVVKPSKWRDFGYSLLSGVNAYFNGGKADPRTLSEIRRDQRVAMLSPQVELLRQKKKREQDAVDAQIDRDYKIAQTDYTRGRLPAEAAQQAAKLKYEQLSDAQRQVLDVYKEIDEFDPATPEHKALADRAATVGVVLSPKKKGAKFTFFQTPDGRIVTGDTSKGTFAVGEQTFAKPPTITTNELPDTLFPSLKTDKDIQISAEAAVGQLPESRRLKAEAATNLPAEYRNEDGSVNEQKLWADYFADPEFRPDPSKYYDNLPSNYAQRKARAIQQGNAANAPIRQAVDTFRVALANHTPSPNAVAVPLTRLVEDFNKLLNIKNPKQRAAALKKYYAEILPNIKVGR